MKSLLLQSSLSVLTLLGSALAVAAPESAAAAAANVAGEAEARGNRYGSHSDQELTALAAHWDSLDRHQRRALLTEMKLRMARNGERKGVIHIRTERRYGRIIRQADGRVIRIETQVVHVRPVNPDDVEARHSFGVGFEQRIGSREEARVVSAPVEGATGQPQAAGAAPRDDGVAAPDAGPSLDSLLDSLAPSTRAPVVKRPPVYQVSDPKP